MDFPYFGIDHVQLAPQSGGQDVARKFFHDIMGLKVTGSDLSCKACILHDVWQPLPPMATKVQIDNELKKTELFGIILSG